MGVCTCIGSCTSLTELWTYTQRRFLILLLQSFLTAGDYGLSPSQSILFATMTLRVELSLSENWDCPHRLLTNLYLKASRLYRFV